MKKENLNYVGGWLSFFIITLVFISPLFNLFLLFSSFPPPGILEIVEILGVISLFVLAGIFLWKKKPYAVQFTKTILITAFVINVILLLLGVLPSNLWGSSFLYYIIWTAYLYKSKRVEQVYGSLKEKRKGYTPWTILALIYALIAPEYAAIFSIVALIKISKNRKLKGIGLSVLALVVSIIFLSLFFVAGMFLGFYEEFYGPPEDVENSCIDFCLGIPEATQYLVEYNFDEEGFICYCVDDNGDPLGQDLFPYAYYPTATGYFGMNIHNQAPPKAL